MRVLKVLVIDDEKLIRWSFEKHFDSKGIKVYCAESGEEGIRLFKEKSPNIVFLDYRLPGMLGLEVLSALKSIDEDAIIILMTAYGSVDIAVEAMKLGATDYINKPFTFDEIEILTENIRNNISISKEVQLLRREQKEKITFSNIVGESPVFKQIKNISKKIAQSETTTILLLGESGTGKDLFARAIHNESSRKENPFVTINCATFPETLLESELFGHEKGAFTDAIKLKKGLFEIAEEGTVFLDEIGEINLATQVKLLSVLENRTIKRVGGTVDIPVDIRIVAATNKNLKKSVEQQIFRDDLYYRLKVFQIDIPALRDHKEDISYLIEYFILTLDKQFKKSIKDIDNKAIDLMLQYSWPGNIRELRNVIERAIILESTDIIQVENLPHEITESFPDMSIANHPYQFLLPDEGVSLERIEKEMIIQALQKTNYNQTKASKMLGLSRDTLRYKQKKHNL